jgi:thiol-disulfide isomerase/thioredoxin
VTKLVLTALLVLAAGPGPGAAGPAAPAAPIIDRAQMQKSIAGHKGRVVLLHMWATWCGPCLVELPLVAKFAVEMKPRGVDVVSISLDPPTARSALKVVQVLKERTGGAIASSIVRIGDPDSFIAGIDPQWAGDIPALFAYDRAGKRRKSHVGEATPAKLDALVADLLAGKGP